MPKNILVIDDDPSIRLLLEKNLHKMNYDDALANDGGEALQLLHSGETFDLILLDIELPGVSGLEVLQMIRTSKSSFAQVPVLVITAHSDKRIVRHAIELGAQDFIVKPFDIGVMLHKVSRWVNTQAEAEWSRLTKNQERALRLTLTTLDAAHRAAEADKAPDYAAAFECGKAIVKIANDREVHGVLDALRKHDGYAFVHSMRTGIYITLFAQAMEFDEHSVQVVATGGILHDIGKARTPLGVLNKPGRLNPDEWTEMRAHVDHTISLLKRRPEIPQEVMEIAWCHHEKIDGSGYPRGLKGSAISELARMAAICDVYVALTDRRSYKPAWEPVKAFEILQKADHFDQKLVNAFRRKVFNRG